MYIMCKVANETVRITNPSNICVMYPICIGPNNTNLFNWFSCMSAYTQSINVCSNLPAVRQPAYGANFFFAFRIVVESVSFDGFKHLEYSQKLE
jgi:hypothetical protein